MHESRLNKDSARGANENGVESRLAEKIGVTTLAADDREVLLAPVLGPFDIVSLHGQRGDRVPPLARFSSSFGFL
jgi:hypothetical protein